MRVGQFTHKNFKTIRERLSVDIVGAHNDFDLYTQIQDRLARHLPAANQSRVFWQLTTNALLNSAISRLCRVYDKTYVGILTYLRIVEHNPTWFNKPHVSKAPKEVREHDRPFKIATLKRAILSVSESHGQHQNALVEQLLHLRNTQVSHIGPGIVGSSQRRPKNPLKFRGFKTLLGRSLRLLNLYSSYYDRSVCSPNLPGRDDFTFVTDAIQERFDHLQGSD
jgi:hypothetical protein